MRKKAVVALAVAAALCLPSMPRASGASEQQVAEALFNKINNKRAKAHNLQRAEEWAVIVQESTEHSRYQAQQGKISHDGFDARANRIRKAGSGINGVCENVAFVSGVNDLKTIVRTIYRGWDKSPGHHRCMFDQDFKTTWAGVGVAKQGSAWYATYIGAQDGSPAQP